jgi:hypothetical protein
MIDVTPPISKSGRPVPRTPELRDRFLTHLARGVTFANAAALCRIGHETFRRWMRDDPEFDMEVAYTRAGLEAIITDGLLAAGAMGDWRALVKLGEVTFPERWAPQRLEITGRNGGAIQIESVEANLNELSLDDLRAMAAQAREAISETESN